ncbi:MAG: hypothetical protein HDR19_08515, partial [Lachnospiraceae bacterium]|nr:hypothetical protein [Lachnospiraceae bacterium]
VPLHKQHIKHMNSQKLVFSNIVRDYDAPPSWISNHQEILKKLRLYTLSIRGYNRFLYHKRLSGLHFVNVKEYYKAVRKQREKFLKVYYEKGIVSKLCSIWMRIYSTKSDERFLYYMVKHSHLKLPQQSENNECLMCNDMKSHNFRPHHGLHFGIWRNVKKADEVFDEYMNTKLCQDFYTEFKEEMEHDAILKEIVEKSPVKVKKVINTMICDFENRLSK